MIQTKTQQTWNNPLMKKTLQRLLLLSVQRIGLYLGLFNFITVLRTLKKMFFCATMKSFKWLNEITAVRSELEMQI